MSLAATRAQSPSLTASSPVDATGAAVLLVTTDDMVWTQFSAAVPELRLEQHDTVADLIGSWDADRAAVVIVDIRIGTDLGPALRQLSEFSRRLVPIALVDQRSAPVAAKFLGSGGLHGQILDSFEPAGTRTAIARGRAEASARSGAAGVSPAPKRTKVSPRVLLGAGATLLAIAVTAAVLLWPRSTPKAPAVKASAATASAPQPKAAVAKSAPSPEKEPPPAAAARDSESRAANASADDLEKLLGDARRAMVEKRYVEPESGSALAAFRAVLAIDAANGEARQGIDRIAEVLVGRAEAAITARDFPAALRALEGARNLRPEHPRLAALDTQIGQKVREFSSTQIEAALQANAIDRAASLLKQAERAGNVTPGQAEQLRERLAKRQAAAGVANSMRLAQARLAQGRLLEPSGDSAMRYVSELAGNPDPENAAEIARLRAELLRRLQADAHTAGVQGRWNEADALLGGLRTAGAPATQINAVEADLAQAKEQARNAAAAREAAAAAVRVAAAQAAASAPPTVVTPPRLRKTLSVQYPESARAAGRQGWVDIDLTVNADGVAENPRIAAAEPPREFESAALRAVRAARFEPGRAADGTAVAATLRLHVRFTLESQ